MLYRIQVLVVCLLLSSLCAEGAYKLSIPKAEIAVIGKKIWQNECGGTVEGLTTWKEGEQWPSFGILHSTLISPQLRVPFKGTFHKLVAFCEQHGEKIPPGILNKNGSCFWKTRQEFLDQFQSPLMKSLREFLQKTIHLQAQFAVQRLHKDVPAIFKSLPEKRHMHVQQQFERVAQSAGGFYPLVDYLNFKGDGIRPHEEYNGYRWGLLQVLEGMTGKDRGRAALQEFAESAKRVLKQRVIHAPKDRHEERWIKGWCNRIDTYFKQTF